MGLRNKKRTKINLMNPFKGLDREFKNSFTGDFASYFEGNGKPEIAKLL